jgi:hypothetical protein
MTSHRFHRPPVDYGESVDGQATPFFCRFRRTDGAIVGDGGSATGRGKEMELERWMWIRSDAYGIDMDNSNS